MKTVENAFSIKIGRFLFLFLFYIIPFFSWGQKQEIEDNESIIQIETPVKSRFFNFFLNRNALYNNDNLKKEAERFQQYEGKTIRQITVMPRAFDYNFSTLDFLNNKGSRFLDKIHSRTKKEVIEKYLLLQEGDTLNSFLLADNERYIRNLRFIQDADIHVKQVEGTDSIDLIVNTKDVLEYVPFLGGASKSFQYLGLADINIFGSGREIGIDFLRDLNRSTPIGFEINYNARNIFSSFIDVNILASTISRNLYDRRKDQLSLMADIKKPLTSQYKRWAWGILTGTQFSENYYSDIYNIGQYEYKLATWDSWIGYNLSAKKNLKKHGIKLKKFISFRYFNNYFLSAPEYIYPRDSFLQKYNSNQGFLTGINLFKQYYFKDHFIYGFGVTEDLPVGFNTSINMGVYRQHDLKSLYAGFNYYNYFLTQGNDFGSLFFRTGTFYSQYGFHDIGVLVGNSLFLRLFQVKNVKIRHYFRWSYAGIFQQRTQEYLKLNNFFGIYGFSSPLASAQHRLSLRIENYYFLPFKVLGFYMAPISIFDINTMHLQNNVSNKHDIYFAIGAGIRIKNENLGLGTIELRGSILPRRLIGDSFINLTVRTSVRFKNTGNYISKPLFIELNSDENKNIF